MGQHDDDYGRRYCSMRADEFVSYEANLDSKKFQKHLFDRVNLMNEIIDFIAKHRGGKPVKSHHTIYGGYSCVFRVEFEDGWAAMRVPLPGYTPFPDEKTRAEANMMLYVAEKTTVPVPRVYHWGYASDNPLGLGPFIIMEYYPDAHHLSGDLADQDVLNKTRQAITNLKYSDAELAKHLLPMARVLVQLDRLEMPKIGSLVLQDSEWAVGSRPLPRSISDAVTMGGCPECVLFPEDKTFSTSSEYYASMADLNMAHFIFQHNGAVTCDDDARDKYTARHLFRRLNNDGSIEKKLRGDTAPTSGDSPERFKMVCDDLTPSNVLVDGNGELVAVIDWEFAYFGPPAMASASPWWLLQCSPDDWEAGVNDWIANYSRVLDIFLRALELEEEGLKSAQLRGNPRDKKLQNLRLSEREELLSVRMRRSWDSGAYWVQWATRKIYSLDLAYWFFIDEDFWGKGEHQAYEDRIGLLSDEEQAIMEGVVRTKMEDRKEPQLWHWRSEDARRYLSCIIGKPHV